MIKKLVVKISLYYKSEMGSGISKYDTPQCRPLNPILVTNTQLLMPDPIYFRLDNPGVLHDVIRVLNTPSACGGVSASSLSLGRGVG
jgi:hypothetical protein